jgi:3-hydroxybutyryl-CoA dehydrogenase
MKTVAVIGAGTMGHGIAQVAAMAGYDVRLTDARLDTMPAALEQIRSNLAGGVQRGKFTPENAENAEKRILLCDELADAVGGTDLVIEAIVEDLGTKRAVFKGIATHAPAGATLATNTSSLSVRAIADATPTPERVLGMHFFNPVHIMKLVEVVRHDRVDQAHLDRVLEVAHAMGKEPILVRDTPGFASSRLGVVLGLEAMRMLEQGVATAEDIDKAMALGYGHPMGPLEVSDLVGLDVRLAIAEYLHRELNRDQYAPPGILRRKVQAGELGRKSGKGFYEWPKTKSF